MFLDLWKIKKHSFQNNQWLSLNIRLYDYLETLIIQPQSDCELD